MVLDVMGAPPEELKEINTPKELIHLFNEVYALSIMEKYAPSEIAHFEEIMLKELNDLKVTLDMKRKDKAWYVLLCMLMRHALQTTVQGEYAQQILEQVITYSDKKNFKSLRNDAVNLYWIVAARDEAFAIFPRMSLAEEPLDYIPSVLHYSFFACRKQVMNYLKRHIPIRKINVGTLQEYFGSLNLSTKDDYIKGLFDIMYIVCINNMTNGGEDLFHLSPDDEEEVKRFGNALYGNISEALNEFVNDVNLVDDCTEDIYRMVVNNIEEDED